MDSKSDKIVDGLNAEINSNSRWWINAVRI